MTKSDIIKDIAAGASFCWTCGGTPNADNFGGMCDSCDVARKARLRRSARILEANNLTDTQEYRALKHLGY